MNKLGFIIFILIFISCVTTHIKKDYSKKYAISEILIHPIFNQHFVCSQHHEGSLKSLGDILGSDCFITKLEHINGRTFMREYESNGEKNEDWYGWHADVLAPFFRYS